MRPTIDEMSCARSGGNETLGIGQDQVSRLEQRSDLLISRLRSYVEAMGQQFEAYAPQIKRWRKERPPSCTLRA
jgi:hypothetical protein